MPHSELPEINLKELSELCALAPEGLIVELGVFKGGSAYALNQVARGRKLHLFDTFSGIPEQSPGDAMSIGAFKETSPEQVRELLPDATLHVGVFPGTLTDDVSDIAFVHIDCDQYQTCKSAIELLWPRMVPGGIMAFDDYPFEGIRKAIHANFEGLIKFTNCQIPYVIKEKK